MFRRYQAHTDDLAKGIRVHRQFDGSTTNLIASAFELHADPMFIMVSGIVIEANRACHAAFGSTYEDPFVGSNIIHRLSAVQPDGLPLRASLDAFNAEFDLKKSVRRQWSYVRLDGSEFVVRSTISLLNEDHRRCSFTVLEDITLAETTRAQRSKSVAKLLLSLDKELMDVSADIGRSAHRAQTTSRSILDIVKRHEIHAEAAVGVAEEVAAAAAGIATSADDIQTCLADTEVVIDRSRIMAGNASEISVSARSEMSELESSIADIGNLAAQISGISGQTNLIAVNASIEAAKAGSDGRGFAVVATEVKRLALASALVAETIKTLLSTLKQDGARSVTALLRIDESIIDLERGIVSIGDVIMQQRKSVDSIVTATGRMTALLHIFGRFRDTAVTDSRRSSDLMDALDIEADVLRGRCATLQESLVKLRGTVSPVENLEPETRS